MTPYYKFAKGFEFRIYDEHAHMIFFGGLPGIMENSVNCHGEVMDDMPRTYWS